MREILFRGKRNDGSGEWVFGFFDHCKPLDPSIWGKGARYQRVDPETVGQFTGLTDKSGKKIFEGDIIKTKMGFIGVVFFGLKEYKLNRDIYTCNGWLFKCKNKIESIDFEILQGEVIGNIHDNPDLLT